MTEELAGRYPRQQQIGDTSILLRPMTAADRDPLLAFARGLPAHDLLFLRRDITDAAIVEQWLSEIEAGTVTTLLAFADGEDRVVGYGTLHRETLPWSAHVGEIRVAVAAGMRGIGLGRVLTQEVFAIAIAGGIEKMVARMTVDQKGAIATFEGLGFRAEAILHDHVQDLAGKRHDLLLMSHDVAEFQRTLDSYGVTDALT